MKITVQYAAQAREAAGTAAESVELDGSGTVRELVLALAGLHGEPLRKLLLDGAGTPHPSLLVFVGDERFRVDDPRPLGREAAVVIMTPISGG